MNNTSELRKQVRRHLPYKVYKRVVILLLGISFAFFVFAVGYEMVNPYVDHYLSTSMDVPGYIDVSLMSEPQNGFSFIEDDEYIYIYYQESLPKELQELVDYSYDRVDNVGFIRVIGTAKEFDDPKQLEALLPAFNEFYGVDYTLAEMVEYTNDYYMVGETVLTEPVTYNDIGLKAGAMAVVFFIPGILVLGVSLFYRTLGKKSFEHIVMNEQGDVLSSEIFQPVYTFRSIGLLLTDHFLVSNHPICFAIDYNDITWVHLQTRKILGIIPQEYTIVLYDQRYKKHRIVSCSALFSKNYNDILMVLELLQEKGIMVGYTNENIQAFRQLKKQ